jgi:hypothetical protein
VRLSTRTRLALWISLALVLLLAHARHYAFTTDDAFISFRYARNLAEGNGLVFNPGGERVEGYTNFLWVLLLAGGRLSGVEPERASHVLSIAATVAVFAVVASFLVRRAPGGTPAWIVTLPLFGLAATRNFAVWSTSGLETRLFELLVVAGLLRLLDETEEDGAARPPVSGLLFGLAALTRPEGILIGAAALGTVALLDRRVGLARAAAFAAPVALHFAFRLAYYGEWLPNTYHAKVGGRTWWDVGGDYLLAFAIEYGAWIWIPLALLVRGRLRTLALAVLVPYLSYLASIGGDHFEYRPLGIVFPVVLTLLGVGAARIGTAMPGRRATAALAPLVLFGLVWLPFRSHATFPADGYRAGFPGRDPGSKEAAAFLDPSSDPVYRLPGLRILAEAHRERLSRLTDHFVGVRQEEHRAFLESLRPQADRLRLWVATGRIPRDLHVALSSVGIVPYASALPTLDRLGLTDRWVARAPAVSDRRAMGHERRDTLDYARRIGVDLSAVRAATLLFDADDPLLLPALAAADGAGLEAAWIEIEPGAILAGTLPQGIEATRAAFPSLPFRPLANPEDWEALADRCLPALERARRDSGASPGPTLALAQALLAAGRPGEARPLLEPLAASHPRWVEALRALAGARAMTGDLAGGREAIARAIDAARAAGSETSELEGIARLLAQRAPSVR